jgi:hypothetical protein
MKFCVWLVLTAVITAFVWVAIEKTQKSRDAVARERAEVAGVDASQRHENVGHRMG